MEGGRQLSQDERMEIRRQRVAARRNKEAGKTTGAKANTEAEKEKISKSKSQITKSRHIIDDAKYQASEIVSDIQVEREHRESIRRWKEETNRAERMENLERELLESTKVNREIEMQWAEVAKKDIPQELYQAIAIQYKAANKLLAEKDEVIKQLQTELKVKDEDYVELLAHHQEDIVKLVIRMKEQFAQFLTTDETELTTIETVFVEERKDTLDQNGDDIENLFTKRRDMELKIIYSKQTREKEFQAELSKIRGRDAEDYNSLKVTLEGNIQLLEQQLEEMRATYQLNTEKLEYNHSVLQERDSENNQTVEHHRQRLRRLKEALSAHKQRFMRQDSKFKGENQELTEEYKRITEQFKDLQKKFRHFEMVDNKKYREVWAMNEENTMQAVKKVLKADELIHEQILGLNYLPPRTNDNAICDLKTITSAQIFNTTDTEAVVAELGQTSSSSSGGGNAGSGGFGAVGAGSGEGTLGSDGLPIEGSQQAETSAAPGLNAKGRFNDQQIKTVMAMLAQETSFLVDNRLQEGLRGLSEEEAEMYKVDAIMSNIGVEDREDLDELVSFFFENEHSEDLAVHPNDVISVVRDFVVKRQQSKTKTGSVGMTARLDSVTSEKKQRKKERERKFWKKLGNVISGKTFKMWGALDSAQRRYNLLLESRAGLIDETTELARQNEELKILLQEYLGSKINQELQIPPTRLIRVEDS